MTTFYKIDGIPFEDYFIRKELFTQGGIWGMGYNEWGQLSDNTNVSKSSPIQTIAGGTNWKLISGGGYHTAAIKTDGTLWTWGNNDHGQLGDNTTAHKSSPAQTVAGGTNWKYVSCGVAHVVAIKTDGTLWSWGNNGHGQLGDNTITHRSSPIQTIVNGTNWKVISTPHRSTVALKTDGTLWTWGDNQWGQLGDETITHRSSPIQTVAGGTNWKLIAMAVDGSHCAAIKTDGTLWNWGNNESGQLGDNTSDKKSSPIQTIAGGTNWKSISTGFQHTVAIKTDGTLWGWGQNWFGNLGTGNQAYPMTPIQTITGGTNWKLINCGRYHNVAIKTDGTLWTWGLNSSGQLGDETVVNKLSPTPVTGGGTNWKSANCGSFHTLTIR